jgi:uncharacterized membrane protein HdeD (DUF308 family)
LVGSVSGVYARAHHHRRGHVKAMSEPRTPAALPTSQEIRTGIANRWLGFVGLGVLSIALGAIGLLMVGALTLVTVFWFGLLLIAGGAVHLLHSMRAQGWRSTVIEAAIGLLYIVAGGLLVVNPLLGSATLTLALGIVILAVGVARMLIAFQHRRDPGWFWLLICGLVGVALGLMILAALPQGALWILGLLVAVELITQGWGMVVMGFTLRRWRRTLRAGQAA